MKAETQAQIQNCYEQNRYNEERMMVNLNVLKRIIKYVKEELQNKSDYDGEAGIPCVAKKISFSAVNKIIITN